MKKQAERVRALRVDVGPAGGRTDLMCIVCGRFRAQYEIRSTLSGEAAHAGIHAKCWQMLRTSKRDARRQKREEKKRARSALPTSIACQVAPTGIGLFGAAGDFAFAGATEKPGEEKT